MICKFISSITENKISPVICKNTSLIIVKNISSMLKTHPSYQDKDFYSLDNLRLIVCSHLVHWFEKSLNGWLFPHEFLETKISDLLTNKHFQITNYNYMQIRKFQDLWQYLHKAQLPQLFYCANKSGVINLISRSKLPKKEFEKNQETNCQKYIWKKTNKQNTSKNKNKIPRKTSCHHNHDPWSWRTLPPPLFKQTIKVLSFFLLFWFVRFFFKDKLKNSFLVSVKM